VDLCAQRGLDRMDGGRRGLQKSDDTEGAALSAPWLGRHGGRPSSFGLILWGGLRRIVGMEEFGRRRPVHQDLHEGFNKPVVVFVTVCTKGKKPILANDEVHRLLRDSWCEAHSWLVGRYVLMPDHLHLFCSPATTQSPLLQQWVSYWKSHAARNWPKPGDAPVWQSDFWDTQLRRVESYDEKWRYVVENPVRAGLVASAEDWPYQGELNTLIW
jgi:putative transposase